MARTVLAIRRSGWNVVIVHGNGPQVGNLAIQQEEGRRLVPAQPLFSLGAMTQGADRQPDQPRPARASRPISRWPPGHPRRRLARRSGVRAPSQADRPVLHRRAGRRARRRARMDRRRRLRPGLPPAWSPRRSPIDDRRDAPRSRRWWRAARSSSPPAAAACRSCPTGSGLRGVEAVIDKDYVAGQLASALGGAGARLRHRRSSVDARFRPTRPNARWTRSTWTPPSGISSDGQFPPGSMGPKVRCRDAVPPFGRGRRGHQHGRVGRPHARRQRGIAGARRSGIGTRIVAARRAARSRDMTADLRMFRDTYVDSVVQLAATPCDERARRRRLGSRRDGDAGEPADAGRRRASPPTTSARPTICSSPCGDATTTSVQDAAVGRRGHACSPAAQAGGGAGPASRAHRTIGRAVRELPDSNVAVVSVPGDVRGARSARGAHRRAGRAAVQRQRVGRRRGGAEGAGRRGSAGCSWGPGRERRCSAASASASPTWSRPGPVGIVAAAGTGAQEAMSLLDRWGVGISCVIGLGGRDLSDAVDGRMAKAAIASLRADPGTDVIFLVSKPPAERVARAVLATADGFPLVAALVGRRAGCAVRSRRAAGAHARGRRAATCWTCSAWNGPTSSAICRSGWPRPASRWRPSAPWSAACSPAGRCATSRWSSSATPLGPVYSNVPLEPSLRVPAPPGSHICLDLGEEEYTVGRPHPMIDPQARVEMLDEQGRDPAVAVDPARRRPRATARTRIPASQLAPACARAVAAGRRGRRLRAGHARRTRRATPGSGRSCSEAGCIVTETAARASLAAAAIAVRDPALVTADDMSAAGDRARHLLHQAARRRGAHPRARGGAHRRRRARAHRDARRAGLRLLPPHDGPVHGRARPAAARTPSSSGSSTPSTRSSAGLRCLRRPIRAGAHPGLHLGAGRRARPRRRDRAARSCAPCTTSTTSRPPR